MRRSRLGEIRSRNQLALVRKIVENEVASVSSAPELFRSNSMSTRLLSSFCQEAGKQSDYLRLVLAKPLEARWQNDRDWEVDPSRMVDH